jgi:hypothetical protein
MDGMEQHVVGQKKGVAGMASSGAPRPFPLLLCRSCLKVSACLDVRKICILHF